ncbi:unnamed protein product [Fusarium fujikuroi]|nr:unnamed protein product [Fusarium fujikuroi]
MASPEPHKTRTTEPAAAYQVTATFAQGQRMAGAAQCIAPNVAGDRVEGGFLRSQRQRTTNRPISTRLNISSSLILHPERAAGMGYHGKPVAVLDMKSDKVRQLDKAAVEGYPAVQIPRLKKNVPIYISRSTEKDKDKEFIAEVNLWSMGVRYNLNRLVGEGPQLYIVNA